MKIIIEQVTMPLCYSAEALKNQIAMILGIVDSEITSIEIIRRSIDARKRRDIPLYILNVAVETSTHVDLSEIKNTKETSGSEPLEIKPITANKKDATRPVIVGAGPAGLAAGFVLAKAGLRPIIIERGKRSEERKAAVTSFWKNGKLDIEDNVLYGEGGAGLFSDGKLTSRSKDKIRTRFFLQMLVEAGAPENILYDFDAHLGSDKLMDICIRLRELIEKMGGEFIFNCRLEDLSFNNQGIVSIITSKQAIKTSDCILATGHSARDIYQMLHRKEITLEPKPFAVGVRLEIPQRLINDSQYGQHKDNPALSAASFSLTAKEEKDFRPCYTFCMCPGGIVIPCASSDGMLTTNGMSFSERAGKFGNAAFLVPVYPKDFDKKSDNILAGISFQEEIEKKAFIAGGGNYSLPASKLLDFLNEKEPVELHRKRNISWKRAVPYDIGKILPDFVTKTLRKAIPEMLNKMDRVKLNECTVFAAETRSSSPVRIVRNENMQSPALKGLYPCGEGSGYSGGIVSSGIDGIKAAEAVLKKYSE